ncbi:MAG: nucleotidyl transferase AbiEii/AbiGii toxin family protein [Candidatus Aminicenantes bacterium]|nr:nucleotidyl transferase AbiEii/AbiGii toxin family protein [Candidatus Aminicenantes bacterium]
MNEAIHQILSKYEIRSLDDSIRALREIMQDIALLGLWRSKFFERAAFYGGTALRVLYGLDRFSEDLDFSLLNPHSDFDLSSYNNALEREMSSFGFEVRIESRGKSVDTAILSTFLKANTRKQMLTVEVDKSLIQQIPRNQQLKIKLEIDTDPPSGFSTANKYLFLPIPFSVRTFILPDLFAGKMHAVLCRGWKSRIKGRGWYDFVWFAANHPELHLFHLEQRMRQTGHWKGLSTFTYGDFHDKLSQRIGQINIEQAARDVEPFVKNTESLALWSKEFFLDVASRIKIV